MSINQHEYLSHALRNARSREEEEHYLYKLRMLEEEAKWNNQRMSANSQEVMLRQQQTPKPVKEEITPLSFLKSADKNLLLTGVTQ